jgi:hypothetical protein
MTTVILTLTRCVACYIKTAFLLRCVFPLRCMARITLEVTDVRRYIDVNCGITVYNEVYIVEQFKYPDFLF